MASTLPIQGHNIKVYHKGIFVGYVQRINGFGNSIVCIVTTIPYRFNKKRAITVKRSAETSSVCYLPQGTKVYVSDGETIFEMVPEEK